MTDDPTAQPDELPDADLPADAEDGEPEDNPPADEPSLPADFDPQEANA